MNQFIGKSLSGSLKEAVNGLNEPKFIILFILKADVRPRRWRRTGQRQRQFPEF